MSLADLDLRVQAEITRLQLEINGHRYADADRDEADFAADALFEGIFLRGFTTFETAVETSFLHYAAGGASVNGYVATSRLTNCSEADARRIIKGDGKYVDWSSASIIRDRASRYFVDGEPFFTEFSGRSDVLSQVEKVRNRIAHDSTEAVTAFRDVERIRFLTERPFVMRPGQLLRARKRSRPHMSICSEYLGVFAAIISRLAQKA